MTHPHEPIPKASAWATICYCFVVGVIATVGIVVGVSAVRFVAMQVWELL